MTDSIDRILGRLEAKVDRVIADQETAGESRKANYERLETIEKGQEAHKREMDALAGRMARVETVTDEYRTLKTMGRGYLIGAAFGGGGIALWLHDNIMAFFKTLK